MVRIDFLKKINFPPVREAKNKVLEDIQCVYVLPEDI